MTSSNPNYLPKTQIANTIVEQGRVSIHEFWWEADILSVIGSNWQNK